MKINNNKSGFTLLEIIIVIIIVGVLASLALPRFFETVEFSRSNEAMNMLGSAKRAADRCSMMGGAVIDYTNCTLFSDLAMENPGIPASSNFCYDITLVGTVWAIQAERALVNGGDGADCNGDGTGTNPAGVSTIAVAIDFTDVNNIIVTRAGTGVFSGIR